MADKEKPPVPKRALEAIRAFGGYSVVVTPTLKVVYCSPNALALPIVSSGMLIHQKLAELASTAWLEGQALVHHEWFTDLGSIEQAEVSATKLAGRCVLLTITDFTAAMRAEQVRHDLVSNIGHELRTPVSGVQVIAEALDVAKDDPEAVTYFSGRLKLEAERMARLIEDILALALAQDRSTERFVTVDLADVVTTAWEHEATRANSEGITLNVAVPAVGEVEVFGDAGALITVLDNLIDNAISYSPAGSVVEVNVMVDRGLGKAILSVADHGIGIEPADQGRIFERFYRSDRARSRRTGGTGLGLAIVKNIVLAHSGSVGVRSQPGIGATFTVVLPLGAPLGTQQDGYLSFLDTQDDE
ncbi:MAG: HAMP domain-containing histidine kinase [Propionibacteriaceae bacterium]|nr:HAMP domain-containing histidine kinase [Propionibacteriaceae bacterium]